MYKLTLCLKYLVKRALAYFAMLGVLVCVFLMLTCVAVLTGFVNKIEVAAKGLFGDVVISSSSLSGLGEYDALIARIKKEVPAVQGASPFILTFGILQLPGNDFRKTVQVAGIRLPERAKVSDFAKGLFIQAGIDEPTFTPAEPLILRRLEQDHDRTVDILNRAKESPAGGKLTSDRRALAERLFNATGFQEQAIANLLNAEETARRVAELDAQIRAADEAGDDGKRDMFEREKAAVERGMILPPDRRAILGLGIAGLSFRTPKGEIIRVIGPGQQVVLSMIPLGRQFSYADISPVTRNFTVIDDCTTDVSSVDSEIVYVPFETLQDLCNMGAQRAAGDASLIVAPARCSQIHVKLKEAPGLSRAESLRRVSDVARQVEAVWADFHREHPDAATSAVSVETWRERQSQLINMIESQRTLMVLILGIISGVAIVLIFVILYVIVVQKTRDIGVLKAVGASNLGVAGIFLAYGGAIGLIGSILGTLAGCAVVWNINPIHDWVGRTFGFQVWNRESFMFDKIPNQVEPGTVLWIVTGAVIAGVFGALLPAVIAAMRQPVEALRYE